MKMLSATCVKSARKTLLTVLVVSVFVIFSAVLLSFVHRVYASSKVGSALEQLGSDNPVAHNDAINRIGNLRDQRRKLNRLSGIFLSFDNTELVKKFGYAYIKANDETRLNMVNVLGVIGATEAVPVLAAALKDGSPQTKMKAAEALGRIKDKSATEALVAALSDKDVAVQAAWALGSIGDPSATQALAGLMNDRDKYVRFQAYMSLRKLRNGGQE